MTFARRLEFEGLGTTFLLAVVVGSGIMAEPLFGDNVAIALLANAIATGAGLVALILMFGTISGAHFNPVVTTLSDAWQKNMPAVEVAPYIATHRRGLRGFGGRTVSGDSMFSASQHVRAWLSGGARSPPPLGSLLRIPGCSAPPSVTPFAVAAYMVSAYWFTSSTSFANSAVTLALESD